MDASLDDKQNQYNLVASLHYTYRYPACSAEKGQHSTNIFGGGTPKITASKDLRLTIYISKTGAKGEKKSLRQIGFSRIS
jgi:hypothetical protein